MKLSEQEIIEALKDGESYTVPESDYGKAEIWLKNSMYFLFSIPTYGGNPSFVSAFKKYQIPDMIAEYISWT